MVLRMRDTSFGFLIQFEAMLADDTSIRVGGTVGTVTWAFLAKLVLNSSEPCMTTHASFQIPSILISNLAKFAVRIFTLLALDQPQFFLILSLLGNAHVPIDTAHAVAFFIAFSAALWTTLDSFGVMVVVEAIARHRAVSLVRAVARVAARVAFLTSSVFLQEEPVFFLEVAVVADHLAVELVAGSAAFWAVHAFDCFFLWVIDCCLVVIAEVVAAEKTADWASELGQGDDE